ncbi:RNA polymerase sigma factor (sigma-70 family) [Pontibacter aydingkolensis]|uniref:Sigma-70 family RNA polymerase sigma factor n=1 Tax=Pontibacter aydingkolensis TaxID=1911536 RepID=A0ABS7CQT4_9BACT|nr:sigma-70 family RNA polymerase sigma factor [Pontibacter aydingkolensis]MBW7466184.1 sigma-70 family RNA polymerase sigma factor [Pontibacter aydingkolensis]
MNTELTNQEKADKFLSICGEDKNIKKHMIYKVLKVHHSYLTSDFDDFYQDTLFACYNAILKYGRVDDCPEKYKGYLYSALRNNYQEHQKRDTKYSNQFVHLYLNPDESDYSDGLLTDDFLTEGEELSNREAYELEELEDSKEIVKLVYQLDEPLREPVLLHYLNKKSYKQIAKILGISFHMVRNRLYMARQELKNKMEKGKL